MIFLQILDIKIFRACNLLGSNHFLDFIAYLSDMLISKGILFIIAFLLLFFSKKDKVIGLILLAGMNVAYFINTFLKEFFQRSRPHEMMVNVHIRDMLCSYAFPSGHTVIAFCFAMIASKFYKRYSLLFFITAGIVGFSRIYEGAHFPSDVFAGMLLGIFVGKVMLFLTKDLRYEF